MAMPKLALSSLDFRSTASTKIKFPSDTSKDSSFDFKWKDYCPTVFRYIREVDKIEAAEYMLSVCIHQTLRELTSAGKSSCLLYLPHDSRFVIKTIRKAEMKVLLEMLPNYYNHLSKYNNTLLTKFYGLHAVVPSIGRKVRFVVMRNIFCSELKIHRRFDLKGSSQGRCVSIREIKETTTLKDLDLSYSFHLESSMRDQLLIQIMHDCNFLEVQGIMGYSLLVGLHVHSPSRRGSLPKGTLNSKMFTGKRSFRWNSFRRGLEQKTTPLADDPTPFSPSCPIRSNYKLGSRIPARAVANKFGSGSVSTHRRVTSKEDYNVLLFIGIIDILQGYDMVKRIEHAYKAIQFDRQTISAVNPTVYSRRFQDFLGNVFQVEDLDLDLDTSSSSSNPL